MASNRKFNVPINLLSLASDPASADEGDVYYNTTDDRIRVYKNGTWVNLAYSDDVGITSTDYITFDTTPESTVPNTTGTMAWDTGEGTPYVVLDPTNGVNLQIGQENVALCYNGTGSTITNGSVVYISGAQGQRPSLALADADTEATSSKTFGMATQDIANGAEGFVTTFGVVNNVNTLGITEGAALWLSSTAGTYTATPPAEPAHLVFVGYCLKASATAGRIFINPQNGYELTELHGVTIDGTPADNEVLAYDTSSGLWINQTSAEAGLIDTSSTAQTKTGNFTSSGDIAAGGVLKSTASSANEGGQIELSIPSSGSTLSGTNVTIDVYQDKLRFFESGGTNRGAYIPLTSTGATVGTSLLGGTTGAMNASYTYASKQSAVSSAGTVLASVSITTNGYPIQVLATGDMENNSAGGWVTLQLYRGSTAIGNIVHAESSAGSENVPFALTALDVPAAGTYTYSLKINSSAGGTFNFGESNGPTITVIELSGPKGDTGAAGTSPNAFTTIATTSGTSPVADSTSDTLTLSAGTGITVTGDSTTDTVTIAVAENTYQPLDADLTELATLGKTSDRVLATNANTGAYEWRTISGSSTSNIVGTSSPTITSPTITTINTGSSGGAISLYNTLLTSGTISIAGTQTTGGINISGGTTFSGTIAIANASTSAHTIAISNGAGIANKTINIGTGSTGGTTAIALGSSSGATSTIALNGDATLTGDLAVNGGDLTSTASTFNLLSSPTTLNIGRPFNSSTTINIGPTGTAASTINIGNSSISNIIGIGDSAGASSTITIGDATYTTLALRGTAINMTGTTTMASKLLVIDGTASVPSIAFTNDTNTGIYSIAADALGFSVGGTSRVTINGSALMVSDSQDSVADTTTTPNTTDAAGMRIGTNGQFTSYYATATGGASHVGLFSDVGTTKQRKIAFTANGDGYFDGSADLGNADYAEYFEWEDGNPNNEDRVGFSVVLVSGSIIRKATELDNLDSIIGIVSAKPAVVGDSAWNYWSGKFIRDKFGRPVVYTNENGIEQWQINPEFDENTEYIPREQRPEWSPIGLMGKLRVYKNQPKGSRWIKMRDIDSEVEEWLVR